MEKIMQKHILFYFFIVVLSSNIFSQEVFKYLSPKENAKLVSLKTNIILRSSDKINYISLKDLIVSVTGTKSGMHKGSLKLSDDNMTIIFVPFKAFSADEVVTVKTYGGPETLSGKKIEPVSFSFETTPLKQLLPLKPFAFYSEDEEIAKVSQSNNKYNLYTKYKLTGLPSDFPLVKVDSINNPADGKIFISNFPYGSSPNIGFYLMIVDNDGSIVKYKKLKDRAFDFKVLPNGNLVYYTNSTWYETDTSLAVIDSFQCGNGYTADLHDFELLPNGHALLFAADPEPVDMSKVINGGDPNAIVTGAVIQELDDSKNVIFEWRSWDYIPITDSYTDLTSANVDYLHLNAIELDNDGNLLVSGRHISMVWKINRMTGDIMWKLGGKENEFQFINENNANAPNFFSYQHDIRRLPNGDITLFDNGNQHSPNYSRAVEYKLDEVNKTATLVWEYRHKPDIYGDAMGSVQRLPNGNTLIGWGRASATGQAVLTEVHPDNTIALELFYPIKQTSYRAYKFPWNSTLFVFSDTIQNVLQGSSYLFNDTNDSVKISVKLNETTGANPDLFISLYNYAPFNPIFDTTAPNIIDKYLRINGENFNTFNCEIHIGLNKYIKTKYLNNILTYFRKTDASIFKPVPTIYDSTNNELVFSSSEFGEFSFGTPQSIDSVFSPVPVKPGNNEIVNEEQPVSLLWSSCGLVNGFCLQISTDSLFNNLVVNDSNIVTPSYQFTSVLNDTSFYWRIRGKNSAGLSSWSNKTKFITASPFIKVVYPNGNETFYADSTYIIRWDDNISNAVKIELIRNDTTISTISDSINSETNAYRWTVASELPPSFSYKIKITTLDSLNLTDSSDENFKIDVISGIKNEVNIPKKYKLFQNFPNPFNPSTIISYSIPKAGLVSVKVYNILGQKIKTLVNKFLSAGSYSINFNAFGLSSGVYYYVLKSNKFSQVKKMILLK